MTNQTAADRFVFRTSTPPQRETIKRFWDSMQAMARDIEQTPMDPRCRALALTKLEEASMWINKGIVFAQEELP